MSYETISVEPMAPACGAIVAGIDLSQALKEAQFEEIHAAMLEHIVLVFRSQELSEDQHVAFARRFGEPQPTIVSAFEKNEAHPEIDILEYDADNPPVATQDLWHTDFAGTEKPTLGTVLYARDIPPGGGDTIWVNANAAHEALSERMKAHLDGLWAYHDNYRPYDAHVRPDLWAGDIFEHNKQQRAGYTPALHPVVRTHPETGKKGLFVNESMTSFIKDMDRRESDYLLRFLFDHLRTPEYQYRHKWRTNDLAVWDNRLSLHYALFDYHQHRLMHRIVIKGEKPY